MTKPEQLWHAGPNYAADAVILNDREQICLIQRKSDGSWALPGGFIDPGEHSLHAAIREAHEETHCIFDGGELVYSGKVNDPRNSSDRWIESDAYLFTTSETELRADDDAADVAWFDLDHLPHPLYGSHAEIIASTLDYIALRETLSRAEPIPTRGGHMAYQYGLYALDNGHLFTKKHDACQFSDQRRSTNSRYYLHKEHLVLSHLRDQGYTMVPSRSVLIGGHTLVSEGLAEADGWRWRAPEEAVYEQYMADVIHSLHQLHEVTPYRIADEPIQQSVESFYREGWGSYTPEARRAVIQKLEQYTPRLHPASARSIPQFIADIDSLAITNPPNPTARYSHHDARQNNIAWHPDHGVKIVDWSWYSPGTEHADSTMFLIDMAKSQRPVENYLADSFDPEHARLLIGFWIMHSLWPTRNDNDTVRLHQVASALTAYQLLQSA